MLSGIFGCDPKYPAVSGCQKKWYDHKNNFQRHCPGCHRLAGSAAPTRKGRTPATRVQSPASSPASAELVGTRSPSRHPANSLKLSLLHPDCCFAKALIRAKLRRGGGARWWRLLSPGARCPEPTVWSVPGSPLCAQLPVGGHTHPCPEGGAPVSGRPAVGSAKTIRQNRKKIWAVEPEESE